MLPQNGHLHRQQQHQPAPFFSLDAPAAAKQMAALNAANQARIAANGRGSTLSTPDGISAGPYLGGIGAAHYPTSRDPSSIQANAHATFPLPSSMKPSAMGAQAPFLEASMSQGNVSRSAPQGSNLKQRLQGFLHNLANIMIKRGTPLPPSLTGVPTPSYDPNHSQWSIIEPSTTEAGAFRLAGKDINLFKLWGAVFQNGGGPALTASNSWNSILPQFDLPEEFPQPQANGSTSVALMLSQYYMAILYPCEEFYKKNIQDQQKRALLARQAGVSLAQQGQGSSTGQARPPQHAVGNGPQPGMPGQPMQRGSMGSAMGMTAQHIPGLSTHVSGAPYPQSTHTPQPPHQRPSSSHNLPQSLHPNPGLTNIEPNSTQAAVHSSDHNLLDQDVQGIKRKLDVDNVDVKRSRQKTEPPDAISPVPGVNVNPDRSVGDLASASTQPPAASSSLVQRTRPQQPLRRKIEYVPLSRELDTYGGRDLKFYAKEMTNAYQRRPMRDLNDWGIVDVECLEMSLRSRLSTEISYALTTMTIVSALRGQAPGSGLPAADCHDLLEEMLDLVVEEAFGDLEDTADTDLSSDCPPVITHREIIQAIYDMESHPFIGLEKKPGWKDPNMGPRQRPANIILAILNIIRNLSLFNNNIEYIGQHGRILDILLRLCVVTRTRAGTIKAGSSVFSLSDLLAVRRDTLNILINISGYIDISPSSIHREANLRIAHRMFDLVTSYIVDPSEAIPPLASIQRSGALISMNSKPPLLTDLALEVFSRFSLSDPNRQVIAKVIPEESIFRLFGCLVHRLPVTDADYQLMIHDVWLSYTEKLIISIYSLLFLSSPDMKQKIKIDRKLGFKCIVLRFIQKFLYLPNLDGRQWFFFLARRAIESMKLLDDAEDMFDVSDTTSSPVMSFGMGFGDGRAKIAEKGTGLLGGHRDMTLELLIMRDVHDDETLFGELESLTRMEVLGQ